MKKNKLNELIRKVGLKKSNYICKGNVKLLEKQIEVAGGSLEKCS